MLFRIQNYPELQVDCDFYKVQALKYLVDGRESRIPTPPAKPELYILYVSVVFLASLFLDVIVSASFFLYVCSDNPAHLLIACVRWSTALSLRRQCRLHGINTHPQGPSDSWQP